MATFTASRLTLARKRRGLNKTQLAEASDVLQRSITEYEAGRTVPEEETVRRLAKALRFPIEFFEGPELEVPEEQSVSFRSMASMKASQRDAARGAGAIAFELQQWLDERFKLPIADIPDLKGMPPEQASASLRERWGLGLQPIRSMVHLLELHGVRVFSLAEQAREVDAFSVWHGSTPFCFLNTIKSFEHGRFDAAHELGHLVLHRHGHPHGRAAEQEANAFASAFLMPAQMVRAHVPRGASLPQLIQLKKTWNVSVAELAHRSHDVGLLSDWLYRGLCIEMGRLGYRTNEPSPMPNRETSQVLNKIFTALRDDGLSKSDVAKALRIHTSDLDAIVFGLVMTSVDGGGSSDASRAQRPNLRLV